MEPTLFEGDRIVANKLIFKLRPPTHGEVVIFKVYTYLNAQEPGNNASRRFMPMGSSSFTKDPKLGDRFTLRDYIKRVGAIAGDKIEIKDRKLFVNDKLVDEPWITDPKYDFNYNFGPEIVPEGCLFVLGDNHQNSQDSHKLGFLPVENVVGKAMFVFYPPKNIKLIH
jgi:signal peptidase I